MVETAESSESPSRYRPGWRRCGAGAAVPAYLASVASYLASPDSDCKASLAYERPVGKALANGAPRYGGHLIERIHGPSVMPTVKLGDVAM